MLLRFVLLLLKMPFVMNVPNILLLFTLLLLAFEFVKILLLRELFIIDELDMLLFVKFELIILLLDKLL